MRENRTLRFDVAGAGNVTMVAGLRSIAKAMGLPPAPTVRAPALDPTCAGGARRNMRPYRDPFLLTAAFKVCTATAPMFCVKAPTLVGVVGPNKHPG